MTNLRKENRELLQLLRTVRDDLNNRARNVAEMYEGNTPLVELGDGIWRRLNDTLDACEPDIPGIPQEPGKLPAHHKQWFDQLKSAGSKGDIALMSCLDSKTFEPRSVLALVGHEDGNFVLTPVGHFCPEENPYEAYLPPRTEEDIAQ